MEFWLSTRTDFRYASPRSLQDAVVMARTELTVDRVRSSRSSRFSALKSWFLQRQRAVAAKAGWEELAVRTVCRLFASLAHGHRAGQAGPPPVERTEAT